MYVDMKSYPVSRRHEVLTRTKECSPRLVFLRALMLPHSRLYWDMVLTMPNRRRRTVWKWQTLYRCSNMVRLTRKSPLYFLHRQKRQSWTLFLPTTIYHWHYQRNDSCLCSVELPHFVSPSESRYPLKQVSCGWRVPCQASCTKKVRGTEKCSCSKISTQPSRLRDVDRKLDSPRFTLLDELMSEIPGKDNYQANLTEEAFDLPAHTTDQRRWENKCRLLPSLV